VQVEQSLSLSNLPYGGFKLTVNNDLTQYNRQSYDVLHFLSDIGGLFAALQGLGSFFVPWFATTLFNSKVTTELFKFYSTERKNQLVTQIRSQADSLEQYIKSLDTH
jgi:hypothetical protein